MGNVAAWLIALLPGLAARVLMALGFGIVVTAGVAITMNTVIDMVWDYLDGASADIVGLISLAGVGEGLGIIFGAIAARVAFQELHSAAKMVLR